MWTCMLVACLCCSWTLGCSGGRRAARVLAYPSFAGCTSWTQSQSASFRQQTTLQTGHIRHVWARSGAGPATRRGTVHQARSPVWQRLPGQVGRTGRFRSAFNMRAALRCAASSHHVEPVGCCAMPGRAARTMQSQSGAAEHAG
jgi:hypothetical protein